jgi:hypothetical protein
VATSALPGDWPQLDDHERILHELHARNRESLRLDVAVMRELGVAEWRDIVLFPTVHAPADFPAMTDEERKAATKAAKEEYEALLFASSGT